MERIVKDKLLHFAQTNNIITNNQHGFIPQRSMCTQMLDCRYDWCKALDYGDKVDVVLIDFRKAFDVVPHSLLLNKLISLGVCSQTVKWQLEFLSDRHQLVYVNGARSTSADVTCGVIKGSVVGPVLFVLYINDLPSACPGYTIELFADDAEPYKVIRSIRDRVVLQSSLTALCAYARQWRLTFSLDKCLYLQLGYSDMSITYTLDDHILRPSNVAKDLGVTVQSNLRSGQHCTEIANKANTRAKLILKASCLVTPIFMRKPS